LTLVRITLTHCCSLPFTRQSVSATENTTASLQELNDRLQINGSWGITVALAFGFAIVVLAYVGSQGLSFNCVFFCPPLKLKSPSFSRISRRPLTCLAASSTPLSALASRWLVRCPRCKWQQTCAPRSSAPLLAARL
jgi:hypothetical protein